jgi:hypothetical protein
MKLCTSGHLVPAGNSPFPQHRLRLCIIFLLHLPLRAVLAQLGAAGARRSRTEQQRELQQRRGGCWQGAVQHPQSGFEAACRHGVKVSGGTSTQVVGGSEQARTQHLHVARRQLDTSRERGEKAEGADLQIQC